MPRFMFLSLVAGGLFLGLAGSSQADEDKTKAILDKAINAHGGEEKLAMFKAEKAKWKGKTDLNINGQNKEVDVSEETSYMLPDKFKHIRIIDADVMGIPISITNVIRFNKGKGSSHTSAGGMDNSEDLNENHLTALKERLHRKQVSRLVCLKEKAYTLSSLDEIKVAGKPAVGIQVKAKGFRDIDLFFDKESGLLVKTRYRTVNPENGKEVSGEETISEYQQVEGLSVPKKIVVYRDGKKVREEKFDEYKLLKKLDNKEFAKPEI